MRNILAEDLVQRHKPAAYGAWLVAIAAIVGFLASLMAYFTPHGPIAQSWGALLVLVSTALLLVALVLIARVSIPRWFFSVLEVLIVLDILGIGFCAYFLEAHVLFFFMAIALLGCILYVWRGDSPRAKGRNAHA
jgi:glycerol-3-phosphate acyltransferase PlsY